MINVCNGIHVNVWCNQLVELREYLNDRAMFSISEVGGMIAMCKHGHH